MATLGSQALADLLVRFLRRETTRTDLTLSDLVALYGPLPTFNELSDYTGSYNDRLRKYLLDELAEEE